MPADSKITPARLKRLAELADKGESARNIAQTIGVSHKTALRWMQERGIKTNGKPGPKTAREKATKDRAADARVGIQDLAVRVTRAEADLHAPGAAVASVRAALAEVITLRESAKKQLEDGTGSLATYKHYVELQTKLAADLQRLEPPPEDDPETDPTNIAAAEKVRAKLQHAINAARRDARCPKCGEHLYR